ncbi:hypothetical protein BGZ97_012437, partial [Linnemannia gamsii]
MDDDNDPSCLETVSVGQGEQLDPNDGIYQDSDSDTIEEENSGGACPSQTTSKPASTVYFLVGNGDLDCSEAVRSPWMVQDIDLANSTNSLYAAVGSELWDSIMTNSVQSLLAKDVILDLGEKAIQFSLMSHQDAENLVLGTVGGNIEVGKLLVALFSSGFLWGDQYYNEAELIKNLWDPLLKTYLEPIAGCKDRWL